LLEVREPHQSRTMHCRHEALYSPLKRPSSLDIGSQQAHYGLDRNASSKRPGLQCQFVDRKASGTPAFSFSSRSASGVFGSGIFVCCASEAQHQSRRFGVVRGQAATKRRFPLILIKPSHYDDDGYVIRWWRTMIPSNSLAAIYGIAADCAERQVLGPDVDIDIEAIDETNTRIDVPALLARFRGLAGFGCVALVGVQSNQYPRALDIARPFRAAGIPVVMGGFHVSGCMSMLDGRAIDLDACRDMGVAMFAGEAEGRLDLVLLDAAADQLAPVYNFIRDLPDLEGMPAPFLPKRYVVRTLGQSASFDAGRGCPYQCSFCT